MLTSLKTPIFPAVVLLLDIDGANENATVEPSILQSIISTLGIRSLYEKASLGKPAMKEENRWCQIQKFC